MDLQNECISNLDFFNTGKKVREKENNSKNNFKSNN